MAIISSVLADDHISYCPNDHALGSLIGVESHSCCTRVLDVHKVLTLWSMEWHFRATLMSDYTGLCETVMVEL